MPRNKEALIRYRIINRLLLEKKSVTMEEMKEACERAPDRAPLGLRTLAGDISDMRSDDRLGYHAPIVCDRETGRYSYSDPGYSIDRFPIGSEELQVLKFAATVLNQFREISYLSQFQGTVQKIVDAINVRRLQEEEAVFPFIGFEQAPVTVGSEFLEPLVQAILNRRVIDLEYQSFRSEKPSHHILHPYYLKEYRNRWYLLAYHDHFREVWVYGLDRVKGLGVVLGKKFIETDFDIADYFRHHVGITRSGDEPEEILVAFSRPQANYIITQPLHESQEVVGEEDLGMPLIAGQKISKEERKVVFRFHLVPTFEFTSQLLGWGSAVEVISPGWLREEIVEGLTASLLNYSEQIAADQS